MVNSPAAFGRGAIFVGTLKNRYAESRIGFVTCLSPPTAKGEGLKPVTRIGVTEVSIHLSLEVSPEDQ